MSGRYCFLCASDEGVFLDVTMDNQDNFVDQLEICLSTKVNEIIKLSNKICYKCAYELGQCTKFVQKYKKSRKTLKPESKTSTPYCCLCFEHVINNRIFDITKDNRAIFNPLRKIRKIFNQNLKEDSDSKLICLTCRYNLDVLYDLKRVYQETATNLKALINEEIDYSNFPKVYTDVVNRKTTITTFPDITYYDFINSDSENNSDNMVRKSQAKNRKKRINMQSKSQNNVQLKARKCDQCHSVVPNGTDMYRFHRTRQTVCKNCWITMDPNKDKLKRRSRQIESNLAETKLCAVFLTDVLDKKLLKKEEEFKIVEDKDNKLDVTSDDNLLEDRLSERHSNITPKSRNNAVKNKTKGKKRQIDVDKDEDVRNVPMKITRLNKKCRNVSEGKVLSDVEQQSTMNLRRGHKRSATVSDQNSDSDISPLKSREKSDNDAKFLSPSSSKSDKKKLKTILEGVTADVRLESTDESSTEDTNSRKTMKNALNAHTNKKKYSHKRSRSSSSSNTETASLAEFKSSQSEEIKQNCHTCDTCGKKFNTKLANIEHSLTHLMQASLKLERVTISSIKEKQELKIDLRKDEVFEESTVWLNKTVSIDKNTDDLSEDIAVNVVDTDDEEIFSLSTKHSTKEKEADKDVSSESSVTAPEDELCAKECTTIENEKKIIEDSEQCTESTVVQNETVTYAEIEQDKNIEETKTENKNIKENKKSKDTKDKDRKISMDEDVDTLKNKDINVHKDTVVKDTSSSTSKFLYSYKFCTNDVEKNKDISAENDIKVTTKQKEKSNNEVKDKEYLHEETTHDNEAITPSIDQLSSSINNITTDNNKYSESSKNNCKNNKSEIIKDIEVRQCDLMSKSQEENINKSEEKETIVSNIINETEILKDQIDLMDTVVINDDETLEKQEDIACLRNMETELSIDVDKSHSAANTVKMDLLNAEELNRAENDNKDELNVTISSADRNNDTVQCAIITEETITVDNSKTKDKLEESINNLEDSVENNTTNNYEAQENSDNNLNDNSINAASMILKEVFDLAAAEVKKREDISSTKNLQDTEETLESITREIRNSADMPSLDPISIMDMEDDNDIMLN